MPTTILRHFCEKIHKKTVGSAKDPLFYLGGVSVVLFVLISLLPISIKSVSLISAMPSPAGFVSENSLTIGPVAKSFQSPDFYVIQKNSLKAFLPPAVLTPQVLATLSEASEEVATTSSGRGGIIEYIVQEGDTIWSIADKFGISLNTVLWANNLSASSVLASGKKLVILPVSGATHLVKAGETMSQIVAKYKGDLQETLAFNEIDDESQVYAGDIVIIPNGVVPPAPVVQPIASPKLAPLVAGYFICPISAPCRVTQGSHWYNAIDFSHGKCWEPVFAAAAGTIQKAKITASNSKWAFGGAGNHITILHPNGTVTFYGHLASLIVGSGQEVSQGQIIGYIGGAYGMAGSGNSTGCHLHFQVTGVRNPFIY
ncbi:MAG: LysM peptidoglycan-binding domain-containing protein [bacterium]|nr:LysM peptidoglycan-binding domain-containing protein [bacterium]